MGNQRTKRLKVVISCFAIFVVFIALSLLALLPRNSYAAVAESKPEVEKIYTGDGGKYDYLTNSLNHNGYSAKDYSISFATNIIFDGGFKPDIEILGDDPIINFIPQELLHKEGKTLYVGQKYGFLVDTVAVEYDHSIWGNDDSTTYSSWIMLFLTTFENDMWANKSMLKTVIKPIFQGRFALVQPNCTNLFAVGYQGYKMFTDIIDPNASVYIKNAVEKETLVPMPTQTDDLVKTYEMLQHERYYLTDIATGIHLENENHLNIGDNGYLLNRRKKLLPLSNPNRRFE